MHELSIATEILRLCEERLAGRRLTTLVRARVAVGELSSVEPALLEHAWDALVTGGRHDGAALAVDWRAAQQSCAQCGPIAERQPGSWLRLCPRCEAPLAVEGGDELDLLEIETAELGAPPGEVTR